MRFRSGSDGHGRIGRGHEAAAVDVLVLFVGLSLKHLCKGNYLRSGQKDC